MHWALHSGGGHADDRGVGPADLQPMSSAGDEQYRPEAEESMANCAPRTGTRFGGGDRWETGGAAAMRRRAFGGDAIS